MKTKTILISYFASIILLTFGLGIFWLILKFLNNIVIPVGGLTFDWGLFADGLFTIWLLTISIFTLGLLGITLITKRNELETPTFAFLLAALLIFSMLGVYTFGFQEGIKTNLEQEVKEWCHDNNLLCKETCNYWQQIQWAKSFDENYIPNR